jgi:hypothetical protein
VRGKVNALRAAQIRGQAREAERQHAMSYFNLSAGYALSPSLVMLCGLPGTGKSHAAALLARVFESTVCNSDVTRKRHAELPPTARPEVAYGSGLYDAEQRRRPTLRSWEARARLSVRGAA